MLMTSPQFTHFFQALGALSDKVGRRKLIIGGWLRMRLYIWDLRLRARLADMDVVRLYGIFYAATEGVAKALVADLVPESQRGTAYGLFNARLALLPYPLRFSLDFMAGTWPMGRFRPSAPFFFGAAMLCSQAFYFGV